MLFDVNKASGVFTAVLFDKEGGKIIWADKFPNVVATVGKNLAWSTLMTGSAYTVTGPYMGLISSVSFSAVAAGDTMSSHSGWLEANSTNAPDYTVSASHNRATCAWAAASAGAIALSSALSFTAAGSGTIEGAFIVLGSGAVNTYTSTAGTLFSAGTFSSAQPVVSGNVLQVSYSVSM